MYFHGVQVAGDRGEAGMPAVTLSVYLSHRLYGAETWRTTEAYMKKIQTFINQWLRRILRIHCPEIISNENLYPRNKQTPTSDEGNGDGLAIVLGDFLVDNM